jgi:hypothetical protein
MGQMTNVTVTLDEAILAQARREAERAGKSLSRYLADLVAAEQARLRAERVAAMDAFFEVARSVKLEGEAYKFNRDEIYDEALSRHERGDLRFGPARAVETGALSGVADAGGAGEFAHAEPAGVRRSAKRRGKKAEDRD